MNELRAQTDRYAKVPAIREMSIGQDRPAVRQVTNEQSKINPCRTRSAPPTRRVLRRAHHKPLNIGDEGSSTANALEEVTISEGIEHNPTIGVVS